MTHSAGVRLRVGTSGYQYKHWRGLFYPRHVRLDAWFEHYASFFDTVELNNTFYRLPEAVTLEKWRDRAPDGFCYALKYSRYGSHLMHLKSPDQHLTPFLNRAGFLGDHLGPVLVQLPPKWGLDLERLRGFLAAAPRRHRWVFEFRHPSWLCPAVYTLLRDYEAALCIHDMIPLHPWEITARWSYLRYHGGRYDGNYAPEHLQAEADRIRSLQDRGIDLYVYFNNDLHGHALMNAAHLRELLTGRPNLLRELQWFW